MSWNLEEAICYYRTQGAPEDQSALIALLREIQRENNCIPEYMVKHCADSYGIKEGILLALIKRIPALRLGRTHCLELCAGPNCGKHRALADLAQKLQQETSVKFEVKFVPCMRMCGKGPNVRWDGRLYHRMTGESLEKLVSGSEDRE